MKKLFLTCALLCGATSIASAQIIFADNFNTELPALAVTSLTNWNVSRDNVDVIGNGGSGASFDLYPGNGYYLDMAGTAGFGRITTLSSFALVPGDYNLSFLLGKNGGGARTMTVSVGSSFVTVLSDALSYTNLVPQSFNFTVNSLTSASIVFDYPNSGGNPGAAGYVIDSVVLSATRTTTVAPEPGSLAFLALGGLALTRRRRQSR
jgi:hypothetical protein